MTGHNALGQGPFETFDRIPEVQRTERRRDGERAIADLVDAMALCAMSAYECQTSLRGRRLGKNGTAGQGKKAAHRYEES
jgi:hypothetical protein